MRKTYQIAGHNFAFCGEELCRAIEALAGFQTFLIEGESAQFSFAEGEDAPDMKQSLYEFSYEDITGSFGRTDQGHLLTLKPENQSALNLWNNSKNEVLISGNLSPILLRYALWVGVGLMVTPYDTVAIHSSCIVYQDKAVLFLGESGTGKSTHTRLWQENIKGTFLLNDDSPFLRVEDGKVWAYGSPWSGKTPCYKQQRYELKACVRLSQAPQNQITKLGTLQAYGAIHPSCPPAFAYDDQLYDHISSFISKLLSTIPFYHLGCLPTPEAARLALSTLFEN